MSKKVKYELHFVITKEVLDSVKAGDKIKVNDWGKPLTVKGVTENYFVMATKQFKDTIYSVCEKKPSEYSHNDMTKGMFHVGTDAWIFGWKGKEYEFDNPEWVQKYLESFETVQEGEEISFISPRRATPIRFIQIGR